MNEAEILSILARVKLPEEGLALEDAVSGLKFLLLDSALAHTGGFKRRAGRLLNLPPDGIKWRMAKFDLLKKYPAKGSYRKLKKK